MQWSDIDSVFRGYGAGKNEESGNRRLACARLHGIRADGLTYAVQLEKLVAEVHKNTRWRRE